MVACCYRQGDNAGNPDEQMRAWMLDHAERYFFEERGPVFVLQIKSTEPAHAATSIRWNNSARAGVTGKALLPQPSIGVNGCSDQWPDPIANQRPRSPDFPKSKSAPIFVTRRRPIDFRRRR